MRTRRGVKHLGDELLECDSLMDEDRGQSRGTEGKQKIWGNIALIERARV